MAIPYGAATLNAADAYRQFAAASFGMPTALAYGGQQMQMGQQAGGLTLQQFPCAAVCCAGGVPMSSQNAAAVAHRSQSSHSASSSQYAAAAAAAAAQHYAFAGASGAASGMGVGMWPPAVAPAHFHQQSTTPGLNI